MDSMEMLQPVHTIPDRMSNLQNSRDGGPAVDSSSYTAQPVFLCGTEVSEEASAFDAHETSVREIGAAQILEVDVGESRGAVDYSIARAEEVRELESSGAAHVEHSEYVDIEVEIAVDVGGGSREQEIALASALKEEKGHAEIVIQPANVNSNVNGIDVEVVLDEERPHRGEIRHEMLTEGAIDEDPTTVTILVEGVGIGNLKGSRNVPEDRDIQIVDQKGTPSKGVDIEITGVGDTVAHTVSTSVGDEEGKAGIGEGKEFYINSAFEQESAAIALLEHGELEVIPEVNLTSGNVPDVVERKATSGQPSSEEGMGTEYSEHTICFPKSSNDQAEEEVHTVSIGNVLISSEDGIQIQGSEYTSCLKKGSVNHVEVESNVTGRADALISSEEEMQIQGSEYTSSLEKSSGDQVDIETHVLSIGDSSMKEGTDNNWMEILDGSDRLTTDVSDILVAGSSIVVDSGTSDGMETLGNSADTMIVPMVISEEAIGTSDLGTTYMVGISTGESSIVFEEVDSSHVMNLESRGLSPEEDRLLVVQLDAFVSEGHKSQDLELTVVDPEVSCGTTLRAADTLNNSVVIDISLEERSPVKELDASAVRISSDVLMFEAIEEEKAGNGGATLDCGGNVGAELVLPVIPIPGDENAIFGVRPADALALGVIASDLATAATSEDDAIVDIRPMEESEETLAVVGALTASDLAPAEIRAQEAAIPNEVSALSSVINTAQEKVVHLVKEEKINEIRDPTAAKSPSAITAVTRTEESIDLPIPEEVTAHQPSATFAEKTTDRVSTTDETEVEMKENMEAEVSAGEPLPFTETAVEKEAVKPIEVMSTTYERTVEMKENMDAEVSVGEPFTETAVEKKAEEKTIEVMSTTEERTVERKENMEAELSAGNSFTETVGEKEAEKTINAASTTADERTVELRDNMEAEVSTEEPFTETAVEKEAEKTVDVVSITRVEMKEDMEAKVSAGEQSTETAVQKEGTAETVVETVVEEVERDTEMGIAETVVGEVDDRDMEMEKSAEGPTGEAPSTAVRETSSDVAKVPEILDNVISAVEAVVEMDTEMKGPTEEAATFTETPSTAVRETSPNVIEVPEFLDNVISAVEAVVEKDTEMETAELVTEFVVEDLTEVEVGVGVDAIDTIETTETILLIETGDDKGGDEAGSHGVLIGVGSSVEKSGLKIIEIASTTVVVGESQDLPELTISEPFVTPPVEEKRIDASAADNVVDSESPMTEGLIVIESAVGRESTVALISVTVAVENNLGESKTAMTQNRPSDGALDEIMCAVALEVHTDQVAYTTVPVVEVPGIVAASDKEEAEPLDLVDEDLSLGIGKEAAVDAALDKFLESNHAVRFAPSDVETLPDIAVEAGGLEEDPSISESSEISPDTSAAKDGLKDGGPGEHLMGSEEVRVLDMEADPTNISAFETDVDLISVCIADPFTSSENVLPAVKESSEEMEHLTENIILEGEGGVEEASDVAASATELGLQDTLHSSSLRMEDGDLLSLSVEGKISALRRLDGSDERAEESFGLDRPAENGNTVAIAEEVALEGEEKSREREVEAAHDAGDVGKSSSVTENDLLLERNAPVELHVEAIAEPNIVSASEPRESSEPVKISVINAKNIIAFDEEVSLVPEDTKECVEQVTTFVALSGVEKVEGASDLATNANELGTSDDSVPQNQDGDFDVVSAQGVPICMILDGSERRKEESSTLDRSNDAGNNSSSVEEVALEKNEKKRGREEENASTEDAEKISKSAKTASEERAVIADGIVDDKTEDVKVDKKRSRDESDALPEVDLLLKAKAAKTGGVLDVDAVAGESQKLNVKEDVSMEADDENEKANTKDEAQSSTTKRYKKRKIALFLGYSGAGYQGMQRNPGAVTIEGELEEALYRAGAIAECNHGDPRKVDWMRAARTDKGVSAVGQVVSGAFFIDPPGFVERLNSHLPKQIRVYGYKRVTASFNAKKLCDRRKYEYVLPTYVFDPSVHLDRESAQAQSSKEEKVAKEIQDVRVTASRMVGAGEGSAGVTNSESEGANLTDGGVVVLVDQTTKVTESVAGEIVVKEVDEINVAADNTPGACEGETGVIISSVIKEVTTLADEGKVRGVSPTLQVVKSVAEEIITTVGNISGAGDGEAGVIIDSEMKEETIIADEGEVVGVDPASKVVDSVTGETVMNGITGEEDNAMKVDKSCTNGTCTLQENVNMAAEVTVGSPIELLGELESTEVVSPEAQLTLEEKRKVLDEKVKSSTYKFGDAEFNRLNRILGQFAGSHNFHNFTTRIKAVDPSAQRYMVSFEAEDVFTVDGMEFVRCTVVGQSFMLHQIRKMIGLTVAVMRGIAPESIISTALRRDTKVNVPMAPELGLFLEECYYSSYNRKFSSTHELLSIESFLKDVKEFKKDFIYPHIVSTEARDSTFALWLHSINDRHFPDFATARENA